MANINEIKTNNKLDSIVFDKFTIKYDKNFNDWRRIEGCDIEIQDNGGIIIIKKFRNGIPIIETQEIDDTNTNIARLFKDFTVNLSGISNLVSDGTITLFEHGTWGGPTYYSQGLSFMPIHWLNSYSQMWPWDLGIPDGKLKNPNKGHNCYGYSVDGKNNVFNISSFPNNSYTNWQMGIIIYTGTYGYDELVDISTKPIIISQFSPKVNITNVECWDIYVGNKLTYHKDKTLVNCWEKYGIVTKLPGQNNYKFDTSFITEGSPFVPEIVDLDDYLNSKNGASIIWGNCPENATWIPKVKDWYKNNDTSIEMLRNNLFTDSGMTGAVTLNLNETVTTDNGEIVPNAHLYAHDPFKNSKIQEVNLVLKNGCGFSVGQNLFRWAGNLEKITISGPPFGSKDVSGMFEGCGKLKSYPNNLIDWGNRGNGLLHTILSSYICYTFEYSGLIEIPSFDTNDRFSKNNTIVCLDWAAQAFNSCGSLTKIGPVIDCTLIDPNSVGSVFKMFSSSTLVDVRIKNLNNGDWRLNGTGEGQNYVGSLPNLNSDSVKYLIDNLMDLTKHDPSRQESEINKIEKSFKNWNSKYKENYSGDDAGYCGLILIKFFKSFNKTSIGEKIISTNSIINNMEIEISNMKQGDIIRFEDNEGNKLYEFTMNGIYTINKSNSSISGFCLYNDNTEQDLVRDVNLKIINGIDSTNPHRSSATLYCPIQWKDKISPDMISSANSKGWTISY